MGTGPAPERSAVEVALSENRGLRDSLEALLKAAGGDHQVLADYLRSRLREAMLILPKAPGLAIRPNTPQLTNQFETIISSANALFEARLDGILSTYQFRLTLRGVNPGKTQEKLEEFVEELNVGIRQMRNRPEGFSVKLCFHGDLPIYDRPGDVRFTCSSIIRNSTGRHFSDSISTKAGDTRISQLELLARFEIYPQPIDICRAIVGSWWLAQRTFPNDAEIGVGPSAKVGDPRDAFEGMIGRSQAGPYCLNTASFPNRVEHWAGDREGAHERIGVVGGPLAEFIPRGF
jgi:hypothetical protein